MEHGALQPDGNWAGGRLQWLDFDASGNTVTGAQFEKLAGKTYYCSEDQAKAAGLKPGGWGPDDCTIPTPQLTGGYSKEKALSQTADLTIDWDISPLWKASFTGGRTWSEGGPSMNFRMSAKPRRKVGNDYLSGNQYSAWDLTGTPSATFSPDLQQQLMNGIAEVDTGSTDSSWKRTEVKQNYFQADVTKLFESGWLDSIQFGAKYRDGKVHRNTGNTYWVCPGRDPADYDNSRYQSGCDPTAGDAQPGFFLSNPISNIAGGFNANVFPGINYPAYIDYLNKTYGGSHNRTEEDFVYNVNEKIYSGYFGPTSAPSACAAMSACAWCAPSSSRSLPTRSRSSTTTSGQRVRRADGVHRPRRCGLPDLQLRERLRAPAA